MEINWEQKYKDLLTDLKNGTMLLKKLEKENAELQSKLQKIQNALDNSIDIEITFKGGYCISVYTPAGVYDGLRNICFDNIKDGSYKGKVVFEE